MCNVLTEDTHVQSRKLCKALLSDMGASSPTGQSSSSPAAEIGLYTIGALLTGLTIATVPFLRRYSGAPYVASAPAARHAVHNFLKAHRQTLPEQPSPRLTDLGAGSGELVLDAATAGYDARGVELNGWLVLQARMAARRLPSEVRGRAQFEWRDLWQCGLEREDVVVVFGVPDIMERVGEMIARECKEGCVVCCNSFPIPGWTALKKSGGVWFYRVGDRHPVSNDFQAMGFVKVKS